MNYCAIRMFIIYCFIFILIVVVSSTKYSKHRVYFLHPNDFVGLSGGKKECAHGTKTYGKRENGDLQTFVEIVNRGKNMFRKTIAEVNYPSSGKSKNNCVITEINIENLNKECKCYEEEIKFNEGGPGAWHFNLTITSARNCPNNHKVSCYAKC